MERFVKVGRIRLFLFLIKLDKRLDVLEVRGELSKKFGSCILYTKDGKSCYKIVLNKYFWTYKTIKLNKPI